MARIVVTGLIVAALVAEVVAAWYILLDGREAEESMERVRRGLTAFRNPPRRPVRTREEATDRSFATMQVSWERVDIQHELRQLAGRRLRQRRAFLACPARRGRRGRGGGGSRPGGEG